MYILIVDNQSLNIVAMYQDSAPNQNRFGGDWARPNLYTHIVCSPQMDPLCAKIENQGGVLVAILDPSKEHIVWEKLRALRDSKLAESDWTQLADAPLIAQDKAAWATYRQELRDLPENTEDPAAPVWPDEPDQEI